MACKSGNCGSKSSGVKPTASSVTVVNTNAVDFTERTTSRAVVRTANKNYSILSPLVKIKPPTGYGVNVLVNGHRHEVSGKDARSVVNSIIQLYADNQITISERTAWYNANIYWLSQLSVKHGYTTVEELLALSPDVDKSLFAKPKEVLEDPTPEIGRAHV